MKAFAAERIGLTSVIGLRLAASQWRDWLHSVLQVGGRSMMSMG
jgi:hypothetical protein